MLIFGDDRVRTRISRFQRSISFEVRRGCRGTKLDKSQIEGVLCRLEFPPRLIVQSAHLKYSI